MTSFLLAILLAFGQSAVTGAISGTVSDPTNAVIPSADVTLLNAGTSKEETLATDGEGRFSFTNLQPGIYTLTVKLPGFADYRREQVIVEVGRTTRLDPVLQVGGTEAEVMVTIEAPVVNTESKEFSTNLNQVAINNLPINGRRWSNFAILTPGSAPDGNFGLISFRGISGLLNNNTVDGGDNNQAFFSEERGRTRISYSISQSAIREFQVNTSNYSAEYGRAAGGVTNAVTKSGTNEIHGDVFYFQRNNKWGARNALAFQSVLSQGVVTRVGIKPEDVRHQFGATVGGPITRDKLFFFLSYDQQRRNFPGLGIFSSPTFLDTVNRATLTAAPRNLTTAQIDESLNFLNSLTGTVPRRGDQTLVLPKLDWQINNQHTFTVNYNRLRWDSPAGIQTQATNTRGKASFGDDFVKIDWGTARLFSTLTSRLLNEFRFQYARDFEFQISQAPAPGEPRTAINGSAPNVFITNGLEFGKPTFLERPAYPDERRSQFTDNMTYASGAYTLKYGVDINRVKNILSNLRFESGAFSYNNINDFIIDYTNWRTPLAATVACVNSTRTAGKCYTSNFSQGFGAQGATISTTDYNFFGQLDWKARPRVTFNFGVRYEYQQMPDAQNPNPGSQTIPNTQLTLNQATSRLPNDKNNFGPRVGTAIGLTGDGKTVLRGGYGLYYGRIINSTIYNALVNTGGSGGQAQVSIAPADALAPVFPRVLTSAPAGQGAIQFFSENFGNPMIHQADLIFEREIFRNTTVSATYLLSIGRKLPTFYDRNLSAPNATQAFAIVGGPFAGQTLTIPVFPTARPLAGFSQVSEISSNVKSTYNGLVLQANRQFSDGLQFMTSYTLSKAEDTNQRSSTFTENNVPFNVFDPDAEKGRSNFDRRHKFVASAVYAPRVTGDGVMQRVLDGWSIAPIFQLYTGFPYDAGISGSFGGAGGINRSGGANRLILVERNAYSGPTLKNFDLRLSRRFYVKEQMNVEFLAEAFNVLNRVQLTSVNQTAYTLSGTTLNYNTAFGTITEASSTLYRERQIQLGFRFNY